MMKTSPYMRWVLLAALALAPVVLPAFWLQNILAKAAVFGIVALSLSFLNTYGGMVSMAQMAAAGLAAYTMAYTSANGSGLGVPLPWPLALLAALGVGTSFGALTGWIAARTRDVYLLMLTLAIGMGVFSFAQQNTELFNAFDGINGVAIPALGTLPLNAPIPFYVLSVVLALLLLALVGYVVRTPFGLALQGLRDNDRRLAALGYRVTLHKVAAFALAGFIAAVGGVLMLWYQGQIAPGSVGLAAATNILVIAVLGGLSRPAGAFAGALVFVLLQTFAADVFYHDRYNTLIGAVFLLVVLFLPAGVLGLTDIVPRLRRWSAARRNTGKTAGLASFTPDQELGDK
jgi:branched-chain amino acid transport system permease protein